MANNRRSPPAKWVIPNVIDPPDKICFQIEVPNNVYHIGAFRGALLNLASARFWQDDLAHSALLVAKVWQDVWDNITVCSDVPLVNDTGITLEELMSTQIRLKPSDHCIIQMWCVDGWQDWYDPRKCGPVGSQPGGGAEATAHPEPGACETYHAQMRASSQWIAPFVVNAGDVITVSNITGAGHDTALSQWNCLDGRTYFAGDCVGFAAFSGGDQLSTAHHMSLIVNIDGTWYDPIAGAVTVPGGVSNSQVVFQVNVPSGALSAIDGSYTFDVEQCNNKIGSWRHVFDFTISTCGWLPVEYPGHPGITAVYSPGVGWVAGYDGATGDSIGGCYMVFPSSIQIASSEVSFSSPLDNGSGGSRYVAYNHYSSGEVLYGALDSGAGTFVDLITSAATADDIEVYVDRASAPYNGSIISKVVLTGPGNVDPFA